MWFKPRRGGIAHQITWIKWNHNVMDIRLKYFIAPLVALSMASSSAFSANYSADTLNYSADSSKSIWTSQSSRTACELVQTIPKYGEAFFSIHPEEPLQFGIYQSRNSGLLVNKARLASLPAPWIHDYTNLQYYPVHIDQRPKSKYLSIFGDDAEVIVSSLLDAKFPTFTYVNMKGLEEKQTVSVVVSAVNFEQRYQEFAKCRDNLLPYAMASLQNKIVYFPEKSTAFNLQSLKDLEYIAEYMNEIKDSRLALVSSTQIAGRSGNKRFKLRAKEILKFFTRKGIKKSRVVITEEFMPKDLASHEKTFRMHVFGPDVLKMYWYSKGGINLSYKKKQRLKLVADYMKYQQKPLHINSHTDGVGKKSNNFRVSKRRGEAVKQYLVSLGVPESKLVVHAYGQSSPMASNRMVRGQVKNRRVELVFSKKH